MTWDGISRGIFLTHGLGWAGGGVFMTATCLNSAWQLQVDSELIKQSLMELLSMMNLLPIALPSSQLIVNMSVPCFWRCDSSTDLELLLR